MEGAKIAQLNAGLATFAEQLRSDSMAAKRVEVAVVTFGPVEVVQNFVTADSFSPATLTASGNTPMGAAIERAVKLVSERKKAYLERTASVTTACGFFSSRMGEVIYDVASATALIRKGESKKSFMFYSVGVENADIGELAQIAVRQPRDSRVVFRPVVRLALRLAEQRFALADLRRARAHQSRRARRLGEGRVVLGAMPAGSPPAARTRS